MSPVEAATVILSHLRDNWNYVMARENREDAIEEQDVIITVPASFDAVARELTMEAATAAGLRFTLLEEPQAAFYSWLANQGDGWRKVIGAGDVVLVCDIGGGTTDFSLITVVDDGGDLSLQRLAIGDHTLSVGIEAGVFERPSGLYDVQFCAILDRDGRYTIGTGSGFRYPDKVAELVRGGMTVGEAMAYIKKEAILLQEQKEQIYIALLSRIVTSIDADISIIFDRFNIPSFEAEIVQTISEYQNVQAIMPRDSQEEPGLQFADNVCSVLRQHKTEQEENECYKILKKRIREI